MAKLRESFTESYLYNGFLDATKPLNQLLDALDPDERELTAEIQRIISEIRSLMKRDKVSPMCKETESIIKRRQDA